MLCYYNMTIHRSDNGFCIIEYSTSDVSIPRELQGKRVNNRFLFSAKGLNLPETPSVEITLTGEWERSRKYGLQYKVKSFVEHLPASKEGIIGYLSSGMIKGIGKSTAHRIYNQFGDKCFDVLEHEPKRLLSISCITEAKLELIILSYNESKSLKDIISFLSPYDISANKCEKIKDHFGATAYQIIRKNPFELTAIPGFGYATVDKIARKLNCSLNDPLRIKSAIRYRMEKYSSENGHLYQIVDVLSTDAHALLNDGFESEVVSINTVHKAINQMIISHELTFEKNHRAIYTWLKFKEESVSAFKIAKLLMQPENSTDIAQHINRAQKELKIILSEKQVEAVKGCFRYPLYLITGGPGSGKTTILKVIQHIYNHIYEDKQIVMAAPTGRASRKMYESTGHESSTLHKLLGLLADGEQGGKTSDEYILADFIIVDESSMIDMFLFHELVTRISPGTKLLLVGDADQLESIGAGNVFRELLSCKAIPKTILDLIYRQSENSLVYINSHKINQGITKLDEGNSYTFITCDDEEMGNAIVLKEYLKAIKQYDMKDVQVLCPRKERGKASVLELNNTIRAQVNPAGPTVPQIDIGVHSYRVNDRVMQIRNTDIVSNGDIGIIKRIKRSRAGDLVIIDFDGRVVEYGKADLVNIVLSYACTIHKSQGSQYKQVIIPLFLAANILLKRNLVYTAITRAEEKVVIVGQKQAFYTAVYRNDNNKRLTFLAARIKREYDKLVSDFEKKKQSQTTEDLKLNA